VCADYNEQLNYLKLQLADLKNHATQMKKCKEDKDPSACEELNGLLSARRAILQQQYDNLAQRGCSQPVDLRSIYRECDPARKSTEKTNSSSRQPTPSAASLKAAGKPPASDSHHQASPVKDASVRGQVRTSEAPQLAAGSSARSLGADRGLGGGVAAGSASTAGNSAPSPNATAGASRPK
jgi:hypothetical protein